MRFPQFMLQKKNFHKSMIALTTQLMTKIYGQLHGDSSTSLHPFTILNLYKIFQKKKNKQQTPSPSHIIEALSHYCQYTVVQYAKLLTIIAEF